MSGSDEAAALASAILSFRQERSDILPSELFSEAAWDLLLSLFVADASGVDITGRIIASRFNISVNVLSRWMIHLTKLGLIVGDVGGDIDDELTLSGKGMDAMERMMKAASRIKASQSQRA